MSKFTKKVYEITEDFRKKAVKKKLKIQEVDQFHKEIRSRYHENLKSINSLIAEIQRKDKFKVQYYGGYRPLSPIDFASKSLLYADKIIIRDTLLDILLWRYTMKPDVLINRLSSLMQCLEALKPLADLDILEIVPGAEFWSEESSGVFMDIIYKLSETDSRLIKESLSGDIINDIARYITKTSSPIVYIPKTRDELYKYASRLFASSLALDINSNLLLSSFLDSELATDIEIYWLGLNKILENRRTKVNRFFQALWCFDLVFISSISIERLIRIREKYGESFKNWREEFRRRCKVLKSINDPKEFYDEAKEIEKEIKIDCQKLHSKIKRIKNTSLISGSLATGSIVASWFMGNPISAIFGVGRLMHVFWEYSKKMKEAKENSMYFLLQVR